MLKLLLRVSVYDHHHGALASLKRNSLMMVIELNM